MATKIYVTKFDVCGKHSFPMDMLRYDQCYPRTSQDAARIEDCMSGHAPTKDKLARFPEGFYRITLTRTSVSNRGPEMARWASFGWSVDPQSIEKDFIGSV